jgi:hypothetical protein
MIAKCRRASTAHAQLCCCHWQLVNKDGGGVDIFHSARFFSIRKAIKTRWKATKKALTDDAHHLALFSGKGHLMWLTKSDCTAITAALRATYSNGNENIDGELVTVSALGGMHDHLLLTALAGTIINYEFHVQENDIHVLNVSEKKKCTGTQISLRPYLYSAAVSSTVDVREGAATRRRGPWRSCRDQNHCLHLGGMDPNNMVPHNDLMVYFIVFFLFY